MQEIIVNDGFYINPHQMKTLFSTLDYAKNENILQGLICPMNYANDDMLRQMEHAIGAPGQLEFIEGSGSFIINTKDDLPAQSVCVNIPDPSTQWVGIICLNRIDELHFLKFYKNKKTGWNGIPASLEELTSQGINNPEEFNQFLNEENIEFEDKWEETTRIEFGFNKLILFRPNLFHSYNDVYGDSKENGRLLQFFFLKQKAQAISN